ncbi:SDR family oxidoreductase [Prosthecobacter sp.]|uniref:SDR family NAD(P)-dependent oxidoreductase n=1 Tax=Prosthecobacter sp. TaxID=1965333 RepID=UPI002489FF18|nr:SDR family oxidoreductase [Prosthecobacter sp.]MDI1310885.1 SDR family NAD(P)-dependent oxidoreductase [Prosthecobacter sp.]
MMKAFSLEGRAALVTGSSQGIGLALANGLHESGARVVCHGLTERPADFPAWASYVPFDLSAPSAPASLVEAAFALEPGLDTLICNAGSFFDVPFLEMTRERWDKTVNLNMASVFFATQAFAKRLVAEKRGGCIVITSSTNGFQAEADSAAYDASKGALVMLTKSLAVSLADHGIRVNGVAPGLIKTPLTAGLHHSSDCGMVEHYEKKILLQRLGDPEDVAGAAVFLCSSAASYITGETIIIDGGLTTGQIGRR